MESQGTYATEGSFEVEDFSPPEFPEAGISVVEDMVVRSRVYSSRWLQPQ